MKPVSLRTKLTLFYVGILALLLAAVGFIYYHALARQLDADASASLAELTSGLHGYLRFDGGVPNLIYDRSDPDAAAFVDRATRFYQIYDANTGRLLAQSAGMAALGLEYTLEEIRGFRDQPLDRDVFTDGGRLRLSNSVITPASGQSYLLQVGERLSAVDNALDRFLRLLMWSIPASLLVAIVAGRWMAARALAPLARLAAASREIDVQDLSRRLPVRGAGDELDKVAVAFNDTLDHLAQAIGDMRQFSTALAHELRTPLAAMRGETELALLHPRTAENYRQGLASQLEELDRLSRLITELLTHARAEAGEIAIARRPVDLAELARSVVQALEPVAAARGVTLSCDASDEMTVVGDSGWLERLLLNLLDNAIKFTPSGGSVRVLLTMVDDSVRLEVRDTGVGISAAALPHVFDRFYQEDAAGSSERGVGLGLSLARWIARRHQATIEADSTPGLGTTITVRLPAQASVDPHIGPSVHR